MDLYHIDIRRGCLMSGRGHMMDSRGNAHIFSIIYYIGG